jgi:Ceramidase
LRAGADHPTGRDGAFRRSGREWLLAIVALAGVGVAFVLPPIPQDPAYHRFIDTRTIAGIPNFWDVVSNGAFLLAGVYGLTKASELISRALRPAYITFCIAVVGVAFGSGYYHFAPSTPSLVWDRLPMAVAFMALFAAILRDRTRWNQSGALLWPLVALGIASVAYWAWTEVRGHGDLRPYALVQFLPLVLMPLMLLICPGSRRSEPWLWGTFAVYVLAKMTEYFDASIYDALGLSGHTIKHLLSALAVMLAMHALLRLQPVMRRSA